MTVDVIHVITLVIISALKKGSVNRNHWWINYNVLYLTWSDFTEIGKGHNPKARSRRHCENRWRQKIQGESQPRPWQPIKLSVVLGRYHKTMSISDKYPRACASVYVVWEWYKTEMKGVSKSQRKFFLWYFSRFSWSTGWPFDEYMWKKLMGEFPD